MEISSLLFRFDSDTDSEATPWKINMEPQITQLEMVFQPSMIMFHVDLQGCIINLTNPYVLRIYSRQLGTNPPKIRAQ